MKQVIAALSFVGLFFDLFAQRPEQALQEWGNKSPIEKVHFHFDREEYMAGETLWFKVYLQSDYQPDTISSVLYVELLREGQSIGTRKVLPVFFGTTNGHIDLPDSLTSGVYLVRAWTPNQLNHDPAYLYNRPVYIYGRTPSSLYEGSRKTTRLEFFPEGGNLVEGLQNTVAVKVTDEQGMPVDFSGTLLDQQNREVTSFKTYHDGMGLFDITPTAGKYFVINTAEPGGPRYELPPAVAQGIAFSIIPHPEGQFFEIRQKPGNDLHQVAYMVGQMQHHLVFRQDFKSMRATHSGVIKTAELRSGILQVTVFNKDGIALAERLCFVDNGEYRMEGQLLKDTVQFEMKSRNRFTVHLPDTIDGSFSISVVDADYAGAPREDNLISRFLLSADLRGYVHRPAWYFSRRDDSTRNGLDLLMMTNGWRRFSWKEMPPVAKTRYIDPGFIRISGQAMLRDSKKPFDKKRLLIYIVASDSARTMQTTQTDEAGRFGIDSLLFFGNARLLLSDPRGKKGFYIDAKLDGDTLHRLFVLPAPDGFYPGSEWLAQRPSRSKFMKEYAQFQEGVGITLSEVRVKARTKTPLQEVEERYASGLFSGMSEKSLDLTNNKETAAYNNIFDYLQFRVPGLEIGTDGADYVVYYRQGPSVSSMGEVPMTIFVNEIMSDATTVASIRASEVALVKVYSSFAGATGNGAGGVMAIYTKKGDDLFDISSGRSFNIRYNGFSVIREFYAPDYQVQKSERDKPDRRITLQWRPDIMVRGVQPKIPLVFYNNDSAKKYRIVVEGMTVDGKLLSLEEEVRDF